VIDTKGNIKSMAHTELYEIIKRLTKQEQEKIPQNVIKNIHNTMDRSYTWKYDNNKKIEEQNLLVETKALIVEMYERYLCPENQKKFWNNYDRICLNMIEEKKAQEYNPDNIFKKKHTINEEIKNIQLPDKIKKETVFKKLINYIKNMFNRK